jgi:hypothetical protein
MGASTGQSTGAKGRGMSLRVAGFVAVVLIVIEASATPAHAYVDPGTGGLILQLLLGGVAGALVIVKLYWEKLIGVFRRGKKADSAPHGQDSTEDRE